jgi:DNA-3-methyladenine glycosylase I
LLCASAMRTLELPFAAAPRLALVAAWPTWPTYNHDSARAMPASTRPSRRPPARAAARPLARRRCAWARDPLDVRYHDREWGVPVRDDRRLFEFLILEGAQAGLSWSTILKKRANYRRALAGFDPRRVARFGPRDVRRLLADDGIVRHRGKIEAAIRNARAFLAVQAEHGSFADYLWRFVEGRPRQNRWRAMRAVPAETEVSRALSADLRRRGFAFVGPTICYAFMQAVGLVNDHTQDCFRQRAIARLGARPIRRLSVAGA